MAQKYAYLAKLDRFGYEITAIGRTEKEAADAVIKSYTNAYKSEHGISPGRDKMPYSDKSYLSLAKTELYVEKLELGKAIWL